MERMAARSTNLSLPPSPIPAKQSRTSFLDDGAN